MHELSRRATRARASVARARSTRRPLAALLLANDIVVRLCNAAHHVVVNRMSIDGLWLMTQHMDDDDDDYLNENTRNDVCRISVLQLTGMQSLLPVVYCCTFFCFGKWGGGGSGGRWDPDGSSLNARSRCWTPCRNNKNNRAFVCQSSMNAHWASLLRGAGGDRLGAGYVELVAWYGSVFFLRSFGSTGAVGGRMADDGLSSRVLSVTCCLDRDWGMSWGVMIAVRNRRIFV
mmetsp:Transcript_16963/g.32170  ORF Transcript_16963/g.32170 Transcript_16963/m.32170 type:complete len:232 (-) Transcript_16963:45-740(-)